MCLQAIQKMVGFVVVISDYEARLIVIVIVIVDVVIIEMFIKFATVQKEGITTLECPSWADHLWKIKSFGVQNRRYGHGRRSDADSGGEHRSSALLWSAERKSAATSSKRD